MDFAIQLAQLKDQFAVQLAEAKGDFHCGGSDLDPGESHSAGQCTMSSHFELLQLLYFERVNPTVTHFVFSCSANARTTREGLLLQIEGKSEGIGERGGSFE